MSPPKIYIRTILLIHSASENKNKISQMNLQEEFEESYNRDLRQLSATKEGKRAIVEQFYREGGTLKAFATRHKLNSSTLSSYKIHYDREKWDANRATEQMIDSHQPSPHPQMPSAVDSQIHESHQFQHAPQQQQQQRHKKRSQSRHQEQAQLTSSAEHQQGQYQSQTYGTGSFNSQPQAAQPQLQSLKSLELRYQPSQTMGQASLVSSHGHPNGNSSSAFQYVPPVSGPTQISNPQVAIGPPADVVSSPTSGYSMENEDLSESNSYESLCQEIDGCAFLLNQSASSWDTLVMRPQYKKLAHKIVHHIDWSWTTCLSVMQQAILPAYQLFFLCKHVAEDYAVSDVDSDGMHEHRKRGSGNKTTASDDEQDVSSYALQLSPTPAISSIWYAHLKRPGKYYQAHEAVFGEHAKYRLLECSEESEEGRMERLRTLKEYIIFLCPSLADDLRIRSTGDSVCVQMNSSSGRAATLPTTAAAVYAAPSNAPAVQT